MENDARQAAQLVKAHKLITAEIGRFIVGQHDVIEQLMIAILAQGHCLLEGVPEVSLELREDRHCPERLALVLRFRAVNDKPHVLKVNISPRQRQ